jgi:7,8-dihydropterin-6-yl-methyl-4-(beta-D-ribofuranosyl)aminobenzene 5'-phosphate synthase
MTSDGPVRVTVLIDNVRGEGLRSQWGLSFWIETPRARVLLDTGASAAFLRNARTLDVPLETAEALVLSHGHFDHGGGLAQAVEAAPGAPLVLHPGALTPRFWQTKTGKADPIGLPEKSVGTILARPEKVVWAIGPREVAPGVWVSGPIPRRHALEEAEANFFFDTGFTLRDHVVDDQALWVVTPGGLVVFSGCAHSGIINTVEYARAAAAAASDADTLPPVRAVLGGFHMLQARKPRLEATADYLAGLDLEVCAPCHCTGKRATGLLRDRLGGAFVEVRSGSRVELE